MNTFYLEKTSAGTQQLTFKTKLFEKRIIFIDCEITNESSNEFAQQIMLLQAASDKPIYLFINSPGGSVRAGLAMLDVMRASVCDINTVIYGCAASMAAIIASAGKRRYISKSSQMMVHEPLIGGSGVAGSTSHFQSITNDLLKLRKELNNLLCEFSGKPYKAISKLTSKDTYLSSDECIKTGFADEIISEITLKEILD